MMYKKFQTETFRCVGRRILLEGVNTSPVYYIYNLIKILKLCLKIPSN